MTHADDAALMRAIEQKYGSLANPQYSFVAETLEARPYSDLVARVGHVFDVQETTDPNDDVSFRYVLTDGAQTWAFDGSMVGPYGLLRRLNRDRTDEVVTRRSAASSALEAELVALIEQAGIRLLSRDTLERTVRPSPTPAHGRGAVPVVVPSPAHITEPVLRHTALSQCSRDGLHATVCRHRYRSVRSICLASWSTGPRWA